MNHSYRDVSCMTGTTPPRTPDERMAHATERIAASIESIRPWFIILVLMVSLLAGVFIGWRWEGHAAQRTEAKP